MIRMYKFDNDKFQPVIDAKAAMRLVYIQSEHFYTVLSDTQLSLDLNTFIVTVLGTCDYYIVLFKQIENRNSILEYDNTTDLLHIDMHKTVYLEG